VGPPRCSNGRPHLWTPPLGKILPLLAQLQPTARPPLLGKEAAEAAATLPFAGGWLGWLGYDLAWEIERLPQLKRDPLPFPVALWYEPASFAVLDHHRQRLWLAAADAEALDLLEQQLQPPAVTVLEQPQAARAGEPPLRLFTQQQAYEAGIRQAKQHIWAGDIFQANLSLRFETTTADHSWNLYRRLQQINPSPFACYWRTPWGSVISCSPERLVQRHGSQLQTRPIAGTRPRGATPAADQQLAETLLSHPKERAEHIMLVDLERNDLGRVCDWGTVQVDELLALEYYSHVIHLVSNVAGRLSPCCGTVEIVRSLFPGGTITGCPKVRCMEIIEHLEPIRRSLFYGSCGYLDGRGNLDLNILIRTLLVGPDAPAQSSTSGAPALLQPVWGQVGAGIVADSEPEKEWFEALQKAQAQLAALGIAAP
jgi:para-aminobenzoate synthetase component I